MSDIHAFAKHLGITLSNPTYLQTALTHRSFVNEHKGDDIEHNERLEFLGDAVLELAVSDYLFKNHPTEPEGALTAYRAALVNTQSLATIAEEIGINEYLRLSKGEAKDTGRARQFILANAVEAIIGALYLDQGYVAAEAFVAAHFYPKLEAIIEHRLWQDAKSRFQELAQEKMGVTPRYETLKEEGPDHDKIFTIGVFLYDVEIALGTGRSKQEAEQDAARVGLAAKGWV